MNIRPALTSDHDDVWSLVKPVLRAGETYPLPRDISREDGLAYWFAKDKTVFIAEDHDKNLIGLYYIKPNTKAAGIIFVIAAMSQKRRSAVRVSHKNFAYIPSTMPKSQDIAACNIIWSSPQIRPQFIYGRKWDLRLSEHFPVYFIIPALGMSMPM